MTTIMLLVGAVLEIASILITARVMAHRMLVREVIDRRLSRQHKG